MRPQLLGEKWHVCDRCGEDYPMSYLTKNKKGYLICERCWDSDNGAPESGDDR